MPLNDLQALLELMDEVDTPFDAWLRVRSAREAQGVLRLHLIVQSPHTREAEDWAITCRNPVSVRLTLRGAGDLEHSTTAGCLVPYREDTLAVYLARAPRGALGLLEICYRAYRQSVESVEGLDACMNAPVVFGRSETVYGLVGRFPAPVARRIQKNLGAAGAHASLVSSPTRNPEHDLEALTFGDSMVIAESFEAART